MEFPAKQIWAIISGNQQLTLFKWIYAIICVNLLVPLFFVDSLAENGVLVNKV